MTRNELLCAILQGVGLPLIQSIIRVGAHRPEVEIEAQLSTLLNVAVESSEAFRDNLEITEEQAEDLELRMAVLSFSSEIICAYYNEHKNIPTHNELKRSVSSISALQSFSEEYLPPESLTDLYPENKDGGSAAVQMIHKVSYLECFTPLLNAVGTFSFGHAQTKMMQDVSTKLREYAAEITRHIVEETSPLMEKRATELSVLRTLINIYVACHEQEVERITALGPEILAAESNDQQVENIWAAFDSRIKILFALLDNIFPKPEKNDDWEDFSDFDDFSDVDFEAHADQPAEEQRPSPLSFYTKESDET